MNRHLEGKRGFSLIELCMVVAIVGLISIVSLPAFFSYRRAAAVRVSGSELRTIFRLARSIAIASGKNTAVAFRKGDAGWRFAIYQDCDDDGVRNDDIRAGIDRLVVPERDVTSRTAGARIGMPEVSIPDPDSNEALSPDDSPVRFNRSQLCSFSPLGTATSGTVFVTDGGELIAAVRVLGTTGRVRTIVFDRLTSRWRERS